jgi:hypothetical protein
VLNPIKIVEVIQPKIAVFVQTVCVEKQGANTKNRHEARDAPKSGEQPDLFTQSGDQDCSCLAGFAL